MVWHTQGSGKSLSMAYFVAILRHHPQMENPTFVIQVDRTDLDDQLHDQFVAVKALVGEVQHAESVTELRSLLRGEGGEVIFSTIEKFRLDEEEAVHPVLSERRNLIVIADGGTPNAIRAKGRLRVSAPPRAAECVVYRFHRHASELRSIGHGGRVRPADSHLRHALI